jgi:hypothetical protein
MPFIVAHPIVPFLRSRALTQRNTETALPKRGINARRVTQVLIITALRFRRDTGATQRL